MLKKPLLIAFLALYSLSVFAETVYVDDTLRVGVRAKPIMNLPSLTVIRSGDKVELLSRKGGYAKIRTPNGIEGWVKNAYLSPHEPAVAKLKASQTEVTQLKSKLDELNNAIQQEQQQTNQLRQENKSLQQKLNRQPTNNIIQPNTETHVLSFSVRDLTKNHLYGILGTIAVLLALGFLFGISWHKKQVTKRLGGLSI